jgi:hypothetical protein
VKKKNEGSIESNESEREKKNISSVPKKSGFEKKYS